MLTKDWRDGVERQKAQMAEAAPSVIPFTPTAKTLACGGCSREMTVSMRTVLAYCPACSAGLGVKK